MQSGTYYRCTCSAVAAAMLLYSMKPLRMYLVLRRKCSDGIPDGSVWGRNSLCFLLLITGVYLIYTAWLWITPEQPSCRQIICVSVIVIVLYILVAYQFYVFHHTAFLHSEKQKAYWKFWKKGLWKNIKGLFR